MSGLNLVNPDERLVFIGDGFKLFYRRIGNARRGTIYEKNKKPGRDVDFTKATIQMLEHCITGWDGVYTVGENGVRTAVPFDSSKIDLIPDEVQAQLVELIGENADAGEVEAGNSPTISASNATTPASPAASVD